VPKEYYSDLASLTEQFAGSGSEVFANTYTRKIEQLSRISEEICRYCGFPRLDS